MWQGGGTGAEQTAGGARRLSFCLYAAGHGAAAHHHPVGAGNSGSKVSQWAASSIDLLVAFFGAILSASDWLEFDYVLCGNL
jgi:hypothetical protein